MYFALLCDEIFVTILSQRHKAYIYFAFYQKSTFMNFSSRINTLNNVYFVWMFIKYTSFNFLWKNTILTSTDLSTPLLNITHFYHFTKVNSYTSHLNHFVATRILIVEKTVFFFYFFMKTNYHWELSYVEFASI